MCVRTVQFFPAGAFACFRLAKFVSAPSMHVSCAAKPARLPPQQCFASTLPVEGHCKLKQRVQAVIPSKISFDF